MAARHDHRQADCRDGSGLAIPGISNAWTMPIKARIDMLATGIRTPIGIKVFGKDLEEMERLAREIEAVVKTVPGTTSAYAERITGGYYLNIEPDCAALARYGLSVGDLQEVIATALGGETGHHHGGRTRTLRRHRALSRATCADPQAIATQVLVPIPTGMMMPQRPFTRMSPGQEPNRSDATGGTMIPWALAIVSLSQGPPGIRTENALLSAYIFIDIRDRDIGGYVRDAQRPCASGCKFKPGYFITWSGQFEYMERAKERLKLVVPLTLLIIFVLLYLNFQRLTETLIVMLSLPFALVGGSG